ncbi:hypothetical protein [Paractinoplanes durhamensis]|uniref:hypothetical protein n=1 Tax=Paractinoplanes durhamensis TaxID=113563 RepID=UPI003636ABA3
MHMHAPGGLTGAQAPNVNVDLLLQAVTGPTHTPAAITPASTPLTQAAPGPSAVNTDLGAGEPATTATAATPQPVTGGATPQASTAAPAKRASRRAAAAEGRTAAGEAAPSSGARRGRSQPAPKKTPRKPVRKAASPAAGAAAGAAADIAAERVYRRMPDDFSAVYRQAGTAAVIADHYGVPRHTAQGWIRRHNRHDATATN